MTSRIQNCHWKSNLTKNSWRKHGKRLVANWTAQTVYSCKKWKWPLVTIVSFEILRTNRFQNWPYFLYLMNICGSHCQKTKKESLRLILYLYLSLSILMEDKSWIKIFLNIISCWLESQFLLICLSITGGIVHSGCGVLYVNQSRPGCSVLRGNINKIIFRQRSWNPWYTYI